MAHDTPPPKEDGLAWSDLIAPARIDFGIFVLLMFGVLHSGKSLVPAEYIYLIVEVLMNSTKGGYRRIIFNLPPGYMKSLLVSVMYTAWRMGVNPSERIIAISYGPDLTHDLSRKTRKLMLSPLYKLIFPNTILDKRSEDSITTTNGGQRYATHVGSDIAGFRADLIVLDDPAQPDEAASELAKQKLRDWYDDVVAQRLLDQSAGVICLVTHRLAPDDLTATFIERGGWFHLSLPLIAETEELFKDRRGRVLMHRLPGQPLNPARDSLETCKKIQNERLGHVWDGQYQQRPRYGGSGLCDVTRVARHNSSAKYELMIHVWDVAGTKGAGDWTACLKFGLTRIPKLGEVFDIIGMIRVRVELPDVRDAIIAANKAENPALIIMDGNGIRLGVFQDLKKGNSERPGMRHLVSGGAMGKVNAANVKAERFRSALIALYDGKIRFPMSMKGLEILLAELASFPDGKNDDLVDCLSIVGAYMQRAISMARRAAAGQPI